MCLEHNLRLQSKQPIEFIWLLDEDDQEGQRLCEELRKRYPQYHAQLVLLPPPPHGWNPKTYKLVEGRKFARGDVLCILDDDTMLPDNWPNVALPFLDKPGVGLAFGLPYYVNFSNTWSSLVSGFVNSNSLLSYIPYTSVTDPFTINGMFYLMRREVLDSIGGFQAITHMFSDDFAIAHLFRIHGYKLAQTPLCHGISTRVQDARHYVSLLQRWFVFPRESILRHVSLRERIIFYAFTVMPTFFPFLLLLSFFLRPSWSKLCATLLYFGGNLALIHHLNKAYLQGATPARKLWVLPVVFVLLPVQIVIALLSPQRVNWRGNIVQVERGGTFSYLQRRA
jgi:ceramide glucosyltransferase